MLRFSFGLIALLAVPIVAHFASAVGFAVLGFDKETAMNLARWDGGFVAGCIAMYLAREQPKTS